MKNTYGFIFVTEDINGYALYVGDKVRVTRKRILYDEGDYDCGIRTIDIPEQSWDGIIVLLLSKGIQIRVDGQYIKPNLTNKGLVKWTWEKL